MTAGSRRALNEAFRTRACAWTFEPDFLGQRYVTCYRAAALVARSRVRFKICVSFIIWEEFSAGHGIEGGREVAR